VALRHSSPHLQPQIAVLEQRIRAAQYTGPRQTTRDVSCPYCGDTATPAGRYVADCWSCGPIAPPMQR
jgi:hypothetical protein